MNIFAIIVSILVSLPVVAETAWRSTGPWGGSASSIAVDGRNPSVLLAGARNTAVFRSSDGGAHWTRLPFPRHFSGTITSVAIQDGLYLAGVEAQRSAFGGVWYSEDGGQTWRQAAGITGCSVQQLTFWAKDPRQVVAATMDGVWRSADAGRNWTRISVPYNHELRAVTAVAIDPGDANIIYAGTTHLPWKTTDGGKTWVSIHEGMLDDSDVFSIYIDPAHPERLLASACSGIYHSDTGGAHWTKFPGIPASERRTHVIRRHPLRPDVLYAATTLGLLRSVNGGRTWRKLNTLHILSLVFDPRTPERLYIAAEGTGLWRSDDSGETLRAINQGFVNRRLTALTAGAGGLAALASDETTGSSVYRSADGGQSWELISKPDDRHLSRLAGCASLPAFLLAGNDRRLLRSADGGHSWRISDLPGTRRLGALACLDGPKPTLWAGTDQGLLRSTDLAATWQAVRLTTADIEHRISHIQADARGRLLVRTAQAVYASEDRGATFRALSILFPLSLLNDIVWLDRSLLAATAHGLYGSDDGGRSWQRRGTGLELGTVNALTAHGRELFVTQFGHTFQSFDEGRSWRRLEAGGAGGASFRALVTGGTGDFGLVALTTDLGLYYLDLSRFR